jgi:hypothetical protein
MALEFKSEFERNPILSTPAQPPVDPCQSIQAQLDELNQFIDENNLLKNFYLWQQLRDEFAKRKEIEETNGGFEEIS